MLPFEKTVLERASDGFVEWQISGLRLESLALTSQYPTTKLVAVFSHDSRPGCRFGVQFPVWEDVSEQGDPDIVVTLLLANIQEQIEAADLGLPTDCVEGVITWIDRY